MRMSESSFKESFYDHSLSSLPLAAGQPTESSTYLYMAGDHHLPHSTEIPVIRVPQHICVSWRNLFYCVEKEPPLWVRVFTRDENERKPVIKRVILNGLSGQFCSGELTAVMGPSGSGKSTLLECIVGLRKRGLAADIKVAQSDPTQKIKVAMINQNDYLIDSFTVHEMLVYASRLRNYSQVEQSKLTGEFDVVIGDTEMALEDQKTNSQNNLMADDYDDEGDVMDFHHRLAFKVIRQLGLLVCADTKARHCSGGQRKRISIALEMISRPNILMLDEPTSGLDSSACYQTVSVMSALSKNPRNPIAVVCTIHQPSARVFSLIDYLYVISSNGFCIYEGTPTDMLYHLSDVGLHCPLFTNPADFIAKVAAGEYGTEALESLIEYKKEQDSLMSEAEGSSEIRLAKYSEMAKYPNWLHFGILLQRCTLQTVRDPLMSGLKFVFYLFTSLFLGLLYGHIGQVSLCPMLVSLFDEPELYTEQRKQFHRETVVAIENLSFLFFTLAFVSFGSMLSTIMNFPNDLTNVRKEKINGWYSLLTYYVAFSVAELPQQFVCAAMYCLIAYPMTGQLIEWPRLGGLFVVNILTALVAQSIGLFLGALCMEDPTQAVFLGPVGMIAIMLFGGFFIRIQLIPFYIRPLSYLSFIRYAFEATAVISYGFDRCYLDEAKLAKLANQTNIRPEWVQMAAKTLGPNGDKLVDDFMRNIGGTYQEDKPFRSVILDQFDFDEHNLAFDLAVLVAFVVVTRVLTYYALSAKINKRD